MSYLWIPGFAGFFTVYSFPAIRFVASDEWLALTWWVTGPLLFIVCALQILALFGDPKKYDAFHAQRWKRKRKSGEPPKVSDRPALILATAIFGPFVLRVVYLFIFIVWLPMLTLAVSRGAVAHDFVVQELSEGGTKNPDTIRFVGHAWMVGGLHRPPDIVWNAAQPGDTIRLHGTGNRWGVFYNEIELIKQE